MCHDAPAVHLLTSEGFGSPLENSPRLVIGLGPFAHSPALLGLELAHRGLTAARYPRHAIACLERHGSEGGGSSRKDRQHFFVVAGAQSGLFQEVLCNISSEEIRGMTITRVLRVTNLSRGAAPQRPQRTHTNPISCCV